MHRCTLCSASDAAVPPEIPRAPLRVRPREVVRRRVVGHRQVAYGTVGTIPDDRIVTFVGFVSGSQEYYYHSCPSGPADSACPTGTRQIPFAQRLASE